MAVASDAQRSEGPGGFRRADERRTSLSQPEIDLVLSLFQGAAIESATYFDNYDLPCPIEVRVNLSGGTQERVVLRRRRRGPNPREAQVEEMLAALGLMVPDLLARSDDGLEILSFLDCPASEWC